MRISISVLLIVVSLMGGCSKGSPTAPGGGRGGNVPDGQPYPDSEQPFLGRDFPRQVLVETNESFSPGRETLMWAEPIRITRIGCRVEFCVLFDVLAGMGHSDRYQGSHFSAVMSVKFGSGPDCSSVEGAGGGIAWPDSEIHIKPADRVAWMGFTYRPKCLFVDGEYTLGGSGSPRENIKGRAMYSLE